MKARDLINDLIKMGWQEDRQNGSHRIFKHPLKTDVIVVPDHGKKGYPDRDLEVNLKTGQIEIIKLEILVSN